ncbi:YjjG family noncanonical pyrimidine nucleotidase [Larkinella ripae]
MYKHIFFDLDHTLWDFDRNSAESISELYDQYRLAEIGIESADVFNRHFCTINRQLWSDYDNNRLSHSDIRYRRFRMVMEAIGVSDHSLCDDMNETYLQLLPRKPHLMESAAELLEYLKDRYVLHIITNGFDEIQALKMASSGLTDYFQHIITIQNAEAKKPDPRIFEFALTRSGAAVNESLMIGDNYEADVRGAQNAGMDVVYYNVENRPINGPAPTYEIRHLKELMAIL